MFSRVERARSSSAKKIITNLKSRITVLFLPMILIHKKNQVAFGLESKIVPR